ncbi:MAG: ABC transporter permease [Actinomycetota bacterium]|nr:ABC transporter permease [Actinomycetota bacterium]
MTATSAPLPPPSTPEEAAALASRHGLRQVGVRPSLRQYVRETWVRRDFAKYLANSRAYAENQDTYLGQLWAVLNPVLNAAVYVLLFGFLLDTKRGMDNVVGFIVVGTFLYKFFQDCVNGGANSIHKNLSLVRALHFPRVILPLSNVMANLTSLLPTLGVMAGFILLSYFVPGTEWGGVDWEWLLIIPAITLLYVFSLGVAFIVARLVAALPDLQNVLGFVLRLGMYASGVIFSIDRYVGNLDNDALLAVMTYQPVAVYLDLARQAVLNESTIPLDGTKWLWGVGWALVFFVVGFIFFWRAEARYGRE